MSATSSAFYEISKTITSPITTPPSANMVDDQGEARAVQLAEKALELIASGEDEVRTCRYAHSYTC